jgi:hypothetical protein
MFFFKLFILIRIYCKKKEEDLFCNTIFTLFIIDRLFFVLNFFIPGLKLASVKAFVQTKDCPVNSSIGPHKLQTALFCTLFVSSILGGGRHGSSAAVTTPRGRIHRPVLHAYFLNKFYLKLRSELKISIRILVVKPLKGEK